MPAVALVYVTIVGLCAAALIDGGRAFARASARHAAQHYAEIALMQARAQLTAALAQQIASGATNLSAPAPTSSATFALTGTVGGAQSGNVDAINVQSHPRVAESRVAATIAVTISSPAGAPLAVRTQYVTVRILRTPPFAMIDGVSDSAASRDVSSEADAGGSSGSAPAPAGSMDPSDTRVHALSECIDGGSGACAGQAYVSADPVNAPSQTPWFNANAQSDGWSR